MKDVSVFDEPRFPAVDAERAPATLSFKMVCTATDEKILYDDPQKQFRVQGYRSTAQMEAQVSVPSKGFFLEIRSDINIKSKFRDHR